MAILNRLVKDFPDSADPLGLMGDLYVELGKTAEAARYRKKFKEMKARDFQTLPDKRDYVLHHRFLVKSRRRTSKTHTNDGNGHFEEVGLMAGGVDVVRNVEVDQVLSITEQKTL